MRVSADWESRRPGGATARRRRYIVTAGASRFRPYAVFTQACAGSMELMSPRPCAPAIVQR